MSTKHGVLTNLKLSISRIFIKSIIFTIYFRPDAKLQAIVYKLVPGLYEKELLRRRAFYKIRTREALQATPEQRGDDTEYLIFGPNENISLMLEYSDAEYVRILFVSRH